MTPTTNKGLALIGLVTAAGLSLGGDCGPTCPPTPLPKPMTEIRAREIDPTLMEGIGFSTTWISGDCRPRMRQTPLECGVDPHPECINERSALRVLVLPTNLSIPKSPACNNDYAIGDLVAHAVLDKKSSDAGELAATLAAGRYALYISKDERCAVCGISEGGSCLFDVPRGAIFTRDLVFDDAAH